MSKVKFGPDVTLSFTIQSRKFSMRGLAFGRPSEMMPVPTLRVDTSLVENVAEGPMPVANGSSSSYAALPFEWIHMKLRWLAKRRPPRFTYSRTFAFREFV